jgi:hypothetical protein
MAGLVVMTGLSIVGLIVGLSLYSRAVIRHSEAIESALETSEEEQRRTAVALADTKDAKALADR